MRFNVVKKVAILFFTIFYGTLSANNIDFVGKWKIDAEQTLKSNSRISGERRKSLKNYFDHVSLEFYKSGAFKEIISSDYHIDGTWNKYHDNLVVVRVGSDDKIIQAKENLEKKIKEFSGDRRKNTRLRQTLYNLNRISARSFWTDRNLIFYKTNFGKDECRIYFHKIN